MKGFSIFQLIVLALQPTILLFQLIRYATLTFFGDVRTSWPSWPGQSSWQLTARLPRSPAGQRPSSSWGEESHLWKTFVDETVALMSPQHFEYMMLFLLEDDFEKKSL